MIFMPLDDGGMGYFNLDAISQVGSESWKRACSGRGQRGDHLAQRFLRSLSERGLERLGVSS